MAGKLSQGLAAETGSSGAEQDDVARVPAQAAGRIANGGEVIARLRKA